ncbi:hypothetical protein Tco_0318818 [Tanacetum coccineum]
MHTQKSNVPVPPSTGVNSCTDASGSQPRSILKKHRIPPAKSDSLKKVEDHLRTIRSSLKTTNRVDSSISSKRTDPIPNVAQDQVIPTGPSVSISFDLDASSGSHISSPLDHHSSSVHHGVADYNSEASSSGEITIPEPNQSTLPHEHIRKWTDSYPLDNIIGNPSRPVSTRKQLATDALWSMQEEIHEFDRLDVWELVPPPDSAMIIALKWIYKVKLDEYGDVLKNKARSCSKGF